MTNGSNGRVPHTKNAQLYAVGLTREEMMSALHVIETILGEKEWRTHFGCNHVRDASSALTAIRWRLRGRS